MIETPLDIAMLLDHATNPQALPRDPATGLYICDGTEPPTELTLPQYESGLQVLLLRERAELR